MDLKVTTAALEVSSEICRGENVFGAESDLIVPDNMPDILSILQISANAATSACDPQNDRVLLTGNVFFNILYVADTPKREVRAINTGAVFSNIFSTPGVRDAMPVLSQVDVSSISYNLANCRKLSVHCELNGKITVYSTSKLELPTSIEGAELLSVPVSCSVIKAQGCAQETVTDSFALPGDKNAAIQILRDEVKITDQAIKTIRNKAIIKGSVGVTVLYDGETGIKKFNGDIPFTKVINVDGLEENMEIEYTVDVQGWETELSADESGEKRTVDVETMLYFNVLGRLSQSYTAISDAYFPGQNLVCERQRLSLSPYFPAEVEECPVKGSVRLPAAAGEAETIYDIGGSAIITKVSQEDGEIDIEGTAAVSILYRTPNPEFPTASQGFEVEFHHRMSGNGHRQPPIVTASLKNLSCSIAGGGALEIRGTAVLTLKQQSDSDISLITAVRLEEEPAAQAPSILISYINNDKSLWEIAKGYNISRDKLMAANDIKSEDELKQKRALIIPR